MNDNGKGGSAPALKEIETDPNLTETVAAIHEYGGDGLVMVAEDVDFLKLGLRNVQGVLKKMNENISRIDLRLIAISADVGRLVDERKRTTAEFHSMRSAIVAAVDEMTKTRARVESLSKE